MLPPSHHCQRLSMPGLADGRCKARVFAGGSARGRLLSIARRSGRDCTSIVRGMVEEVERLGLMEGLPNSAGVEEHEPGGRSIHVRLPPRVYGRLKRQARHLGVRQNSVGHLLGIAVDLALGFRSDQEWVEFFAAAEDLSSRVFEALMRDLDPWFLIEPNLRQMMGSLDPG